MEANRRDRLPNTRKRLHQRGQYDLLCCRSVLDLRMSRNINQEDIFAGEESEDRIRPSADFES